jgi:hypothetical protein
MASRQQVTGALFLPCVRQQKFLLLLFFSVVLLLDPFRFYERTWEMEVITQQSAASLQSSVGILCFSHTK